MLIVIVIIGILAAALIPRLTSARGRANDTARKADLQQVAAALVTYQIDFGRFPTDPVIPTVWEIESNLQDVGMTIAPKDPSLDRQFQAVTAGTDSKANSCPGSMPTAWEYQYRTISKNWITKAGFVLVAGAETKGWANRIQASTDTNKYTSDGCIAADTEHKDIDLCTTITEGTAYTNWWCTFSIDSDHDVLRYVYTY